jgi:hypothetical protein
VATREVAVRPIPAFPKGRRKMPDRKTTIKEVPTIHPISTEMGFFINTMAGKTGSRKDKCNFNLSDYRFITLLNIYFGINFLRQPLKKGFF